MHIETRGRDRIAIARTTRPGGHRSPTPAHGVTGRRRAAAGVLAAALVAAACSGDTESTTEVASPTFERAGGDSLAFAEPVSSVSDLVPPAAEGEAWTIVGSVFDPAEQAAEATVWTSEDAEDWESTTIDPDSEGTGESLAAAEATDDGLLAVGQVGDGAEADAAIWRLVEGEWQQARPDEMGGDHEQWAFDVASGDGGTLVAGGENVWGEVRPRLWLSTDGETWETVDGGAGGPLDASGEESVRDVTALGAGFVAVGSRTVESEQDGVVWYSADGTSWEEVEAPSLGGAGRQEVLAITAAKDGGVVAGGFTTDANGQGQPVTWRSADGVAWGAASAPLPMEDGRAGASDLAVRSITVAPGGQLVAAGGSEWRPHLWQSPDGGANWRALPDPVHGKLFQGGVALQDAAADGTITVALGSEPSVLLLDGPRWADAAGDAFPTGGAQPFATSVALGPDGAIAAGGRFTEQAGETPKTYTGQVWRQDGDDWAPVETDRLTAGHVMDAVRFAGGFAAVGFEDFSVANSRDFAGDQEPDGLVWVSPDGAEWARIGLADARINEEYLNYLDDPDPEVTAGIIAQIEAEEPPESAPPAGGSGTRSLAAVAPIADGFIAVGSVYDRGNADPIIVLSPDGLGFAGETPVHTGPGIQHYSDVCVNPDDRAVAVGVAGATGAVDAIVAVRGQSGAWAAGEGTFTGDGDQQANGCAASADGFIVVGSDDSSGNIDGRVWTSEDGVTWTEIESSLLGGTGDQWASAVAPSPDGGWLVAGTDTAAGDGDIALWLVSASGEVERRDRGETALGGPGEQSVASVAIDEDGGVTLAGNDYGRAGLWYSDTLAR